MSRIPRIVLCSVAFLFGAVVAGADVRSRVRIRMQPEALQPAKTGELYSGMLELMSPKDGVIEAIEIGGEGWKSRAIGVRSGTLITRGEAVEVPFEANVLDESKKLEVRVTFDGTETRKRFDLSPERFARRGKDRPIMRLESVEPQPDVADASGDPGTRGCDDQLIRLRGRFEYERAGRDFSLPPDGDFNDPGDVMPADNSIPPDGDFTDPGDVTGVDNSIPPDGDFNDPADVPPAIIGVDGISFQIMDEDDVSDEVMFEGYTDINGYFDVTICWDDCDISGCDDPDIYVRFECDTGVVSVQDGYDPLEEDYSWSTADDPWDDFTGNDLHFGAMRPPVGDDPAVHIHNSITRAHRFILENNGDYLAHVDAQWPEDSTSYQPFFEEIYIDPTEEWNEGTQTHEWGHHLFNHWLDLPDTSYCNGNCDDLFPNPCQPNEPCEDGDGGHCVWCRENDVDAWNEGFANWLGSVNLRNWQARYGIGPWTQVTRGTSNDDNRYTLEAVQQCCNIGMLDDPWTTEGFVSALLRDIEDPPQDPGQTRCPQDALGLGPDEILAVTRDTQPIRIIEFIERFRVRYSQFDVDFWSTCGAVAPVYLTPWAAAVPPVQIVTTPGCRTYQAGETIVLTVETNGSRFSQCMQWQRNGVALTDGPAFGSAFIAGSNTNMLTITNATTGAAGGYTLTVTSCDGPPPPATCGGSQNVTSAPIPVYIFGANGPGYRITGWGSNAYGALGRGSNQPNEDGNPADVINLTNAIAVSAGHFHSVAALADGTAWSWGSVYLGNGTDQASNTPVQVNNLSDIVAVSAGQYLNGMALDAHGHVWTWGSNFQGLLGYPQPNGVALSPGQVNLECVIGISMGDYHAAAITGDGSLWMWGSNVNGELGQGTTGGASETPLRVTDLSNVVDVDCGSVHTLALRADGTLWACGANSYGQLGDGTRDNRNRFVQVAAMTNVTTIAAGWIHSLAVQSDGSAWAWGLNGGLGTGLPNSWIITPARVLRVPAVRAVDVGSSHAAFVTTDGTIWTCGSNYPWVLGRPVTPLFPADLPAPIDTRVGAAVQISTGASSSMVIAPGARIITPVTDVLAAGASTARLNVSAVGELPINYAWRRREPDGTITLLADTGRFSGVSTPTLTITQTDISDTGVYEVRVWNTANDVISNQTRLVTPPFLNPFDTPQDVTDWWNNERGNWSVTNGTYAAGVPNYFPATYNSFELPQSNFLIEFDVVNASIENYNMNGGIWLHSRMAVEPHGLLLAWGDALQWPPDRGDVYWHRNYGGGWSPAQNIAASVFTAGQTIHLRVEVRGDTYAAYLNGSPAPVTTFTSSEFTADRIALLDNASPGTSFDNVFIQTLTNCEPGSGNEPVRIIQRPQSQSVPVGTLVALSVVATGTGPLSYQWLREGTRIQDATAPTFSFGASAGTAGRWECTVTNACGSVGSYPAFVSIAGGPPGDMDGDGHVSIGDLTILLSAFGACAGDPNYAPAADLSGDNCVSLADLTVLLANFGM